MLGCTLEGHVKPSLRDYRARMLDMTAADVKVCEEAVEEVYVTVEQASLC